MITSKLTKLTRLCLNGSHIMTAPEEPSPLLGLVFGLPLMDIPDHPLCARGIRCGAALASLSCLPDLVELLVCPYDLRDRGAQQLAAAPSRLTGLTSLAVQGNSITNAGAVALGAAHTGLREVKVFDGHGVTQEGTGAAAASGAGGVHQHHGIEPCWLSHDVVFG